MTPKQAWRTSGSKEVSVKSKYLTQPLKPGSPFPPRATCSKVHYQALLLLLSRLKTAENSGDSKLVFHVPPSQLYDLQEEKLFKSLKSSWVDLSTIHS